MRVVFGTAQLLGAGPGPTQSTALLQSAWDQGCRAFDTAPAYGGGRTEAALGEFLAGREDRLVSTKAGLAPIVGSPGLRKAAVGIARRVLPRSVVDRLRTGAAEATLGHFDPADVRSSVEASTQRLGRLDRLLLHEVRPADVTDELLDLLRELLGAGVVGAVGTATRNEVTAEVVALAPDVLTTVHVAVGPFAPPVHLPPTVTARVGHGLLGDGGSALARSSEALALDEQLAARWGDVVAGTGYEGPGGLARALLSRAGTLGLTDVIVATRSLDRVTDTLGYPTRPLPEPVDVVLRAVLDRATAAGTGEQD